MSKPWMKFYPADWQADPALRSCSLSARGLWVEMLSVMQKSERVGYLLVNGKTPTERSLAVLCGASSREVSRGLAELESAGVFSRDGDQVIFSRRMVRDEERANRDKANGSRGGNPRLKQEDNGGVNPPVDGGDKAQKPEARKISVSDETGADAPSIDPDKQAWTDGVRLLRSAGRATEPAARSFIGRLLKDHPVLQARDLLPSIAQAMANGTQDPQGYLTKAAAQVSARKGGVVPSAPAEPIDWPERVRIWRQTNQWLPHWGAPPDDPQCACPRGLLEAAP